MSSQAQFCWDVVAFLSCTASFVFTYSRHNMLSGLLESWHTAPGFVQLALFVQAGWMGIVAVTLISGQAHASPREALSYLVGAGVSAAVLINLARNGRREAPEVVAPATNSNGAGPSPATPRRDRTFAQPAPPEQRPPAN